MSNIILDPATKKPIDLAVLFARFAAYSLAQSQSGAYDQPVYTGQEENAVNKHYEIQDQINNEKGLHY